MKSINEQIIETAQKYIGQKELQGNSGFEDSAFWFKMEAVGFDPGEAWCALFTELVWRESYGVLDSTFDPELNKLFSDSAVTTYNNFKKAGWKVDQTPEVGAIFIWQMYKNGLQHWSGHAAVMIEKPLPMKEHIITIEGNTNVEGQREGIGVFEKTRVLDFEPRNYGLVAKGFIHPKQIQL